MFTIFKNHIVYEIMWNGGAGQATDDNINTAHALCMLDN